MNALGFVVIEYNQASRWPELHTEVLYETEREAFDAATIACEHTREVGRRETFAVAEVVERFVMER